MPVKIEQEYTPVAATTGKRVHAVSFEQPNRTMCGRAFRGWSVSPGKKLNCHDCKLGILKVRDKNRAKS